jgi:hypothetical protein
VNTGKHECKKQGWRFQEKILRKIGRNNVIRKEVRRKQIKSVKEEEQEDNMSEFEK